MNSPPTILFVTGKLAEPALRRAVAELAASSEFIPEVAVMPITVAALMTTEWIARRLIVPSPVSRVVLPGFVSGGLQELKRLTAASVELGPKDLRDLPEFFGQTDRRGEGYGRYDIQIIAEINHAPNRTRESLFAEARRLRNDGADVIDLGCNPGETWAEVGDIVRAMRDDGYRVSIDSFNVREVEIALKAGAELVLSVNSSNVENAKEWSQQFGTEVVAIPDSPSDLDSLDATIHRLSRDAVAFRIDPILEPIGFGFAASLGRYLTVRKKYPDAEIMMGVGNLTELTDADSAGINVLLLGFCQELGIRSVLTTQVVNWARTSVKELDLARRLVFHAASQGVPPKRIEPRLVMLRDPRTKPMGEEALRELAGNIRDRNYRLFAERGELHLINSDLHLRGVDAFELFDQLMQADPRIDPSHAFYLGYEFSKAVTALTLDKQYTQDQALCFGLLTIEEPVHRARRASE